MQNCPTSLPGLLHDGFLNNTEGEYMRSDGGCESWCAIFTESGRRERETVFDIFILMYSAQSCSDYFYVHLHLTYYLA